MCSTVRRGYDNASSAPLRLCSPPAALTGRPRPPGPQAASAPGPQAASAPGPQADSAPGPQAASAPGSPGGLGPRPSGGLGPRPSGGLGPGPSGGLGPRPSGGLGPRPSGGLGPRPRPVTRRRRRLARPLTRPRLSGNLVSRCKGGGIAQRSFDPWQLVADHQGVRGVLRKGIGDGPLVEFLCRRGLEFCDACTATECDRHVVPDSCYIDWHLGADEGRRCQPPVPG